VYVCFAANKCGLPGRSESCKQNRTEKSRTQHNTTQQTPASPFLPPSLPPSPSPSLLQQSRNLCSIPRRPAGLHPPKFKSSTVLPHSPNQGPRRGLPLLICSPPPKRILLPGGAASSNRLACADYHSSRPADHQQRAPVCGLAGGKEIDPWMLDDATEQQSGQEGCDGGVVISWVFSNAWPDDAGGVCPGLRLREKEEMVYRVLRTSPGIRYSIVQRAIRIPRCTSTFGAGKSNTGIAAVCCHKGGHFPPSSWRS
jgi:hypothetical protein